MSPCIRSRRNRGQNVQGWAWLAWQKASWVFPLRTSRQSRQPCKRSSENLVQPIQRQNRPCYHGSQLQSMGFRNIDWFGRLTASLLCQRTISPRRIDDYSASHQLPEAKVIKLQPGNHWTSICNSNLLQHSCVTGSLEKSHE